MVQQYELPVTVKKDGDGFMAVCPVWKDCYAQGDTIDEAVAEITGVAATLIEIYQEEGMNIPLRVSKKTKAQGELRFNLPLVVSAA